MAAGADKVDFFISRAGADKALAQDIGRILEDAGHTTILQDWDFGAASFMAKMHDALQRSRRTIALLSDAYLASPYCDAEWQAILAADPRNFDQNLIVLRVGNCRLVGLLTALAYTDLVPLLDQPGLLRDVVLASVRPGRERNADDAATVFRRAAGPLLHADIGPLPNFTGRDEAMTAIDAALDAGETVAVTQAAVHGLGGVGKSALAREYGWRRRDHYAGVWIINAAGAATIESGLIDLGARFIRDLDKAQDRAEAARTTLSRTLPAFSKPWLLIYDNLETEALLRAWAPKENAKVLATTRATNLSGALRRVPLETWSRAESLGYLRREASRDDLTDADLDGIAEDLGDLPLALSHAAAYLRDNAAVTAARYRARIAYHMARAPQGFEGQKSVFATYQEAIAGVGSRHPGAAAVMRLAAWLAPEDIPREVFTQAPDLYPDPLAALAADGDRLDETLGALNRTSLIRYTADRQVFSIHRMVQASARVEGDQGDLAVAIRVLDAAYPDVEFANWQSCARLTDHVCHLNERIGDDIVNTLPGAILGRLLRQTASYLRECAAFARAEPVFRRALAIDKAIYGSDHPDVAIDLNNLAGLLRATNRLVEAEPLYRQALAITEAMPGPDIPMVATCLNDLAGLLRATNRAEEAEPLYRRALTITEARLGPDDPMVATCLNDFAGLLRATNRAEEAEPLYRRALAITEARLGPDHPTVATRLNNLARLLRSTKRAGEAEPLYRRALAITEASLGPDHPTVATRLNNLARLLRSTNRAGEAEPLYRRALTVTEASLGPDHPTVAIRLNNLAGLLRATNRLGEAEPLRRRGLLILLRFTRDTGHLHPSLKIAARNYQYFLQKSGCPEGEFPSRIAELAHDAGLDEGLFARVLEHVSKG